MLWRQHGALSTLLLPLLRLLRAGAPRRPLLLLPCRCLLLLLPCRRLLLLPWSLLAVERRCSWWSVRHLLREWRVRPLLLVARQRRPRPMLLLRRHAAGPLGRPLRRARTPLLLMRWWLVVLRLPRPAWLWCLGERRPLLLCGICRPGINKQCCFKTAAMKDAGALDL